MALSFGDGGIIKMYNLGMSNHSLLVSLFFLVTHFSIDCCSMHKVTDLIKFETIPGLFSIEASGEWKFELSLI